MDTTLLLNIVSDKSKTVVYEGSYTHFKNLKQQVKELVERWLKNNREKNFQELQARLSEMRKSSRNFQDHKFQEEILVKQHTASFLSLLRTTASNLGSFLNLDEDTTQISAKTVMKWNTVLEKAYEQQLAESQSEMQEPSTDELSMRALLQNLNRALAKTVLEKESLHIL